MFGPSGDSIIFMNGCGEPLMDPDLPARIKAVSGLGYKPRLFTNGDFLYDDLYPSGVDKVIVSSAIDLDGEKTHNWAGQAGFPNRLETHCLPLETGRGYINVDGYIGQCCLDYDVKYPVGHVECLQDLPGKDCTVIPLCDGCGGSP